MWNLGTKKLDHSEYDTFKEFYTKDWQKFVDYNIIDVRLVDQLDDKMKLLELAFTMAYDAKVNFEDVFSQVRMWDNIIYVNYLNVKLPSHPRKKQEKIINMLVHTLRNLNQDFMTGLSVLTLTLYPHLIMQYNLSPETLKDQTDTLQQQWISLLEQEDRTV